VQVREVRKHGGEIDEAESGDTQVFAGAIDRLLRRRRGYDRAGDTPCSIDMLPPV